MLATSDGALVAPWSPNCQLNAFFATRLKQTTYKQLILACRMTKSYSVSIGDKKNE
jgi:hypothetical protein